MEIASTDWADFAQNVSDDAAEHSKGYGFLDAIQETLLGIGATIIDSGETTDKQALALRNIADGVSKWTRNTYPDPEDRS